MLISKSTKRWLINQLRQYIKGRTDFIDAVVGRGGYNTQELLGHIHELQELINFIKTLE